MNIIRKNRPSKLLQLDPFHSILDLPTGRLVLYLSLAYISCYLGFGMAYYFLVEGAKSKSCNLGFKDGIIDAIYLTAETMATIGYGVPDVSFNNCSSMFFVLS